MGCYRPLSTCMRAWVVYCGEAGIGLTAEVMLIVGEIEEGMDRDRPLYRTTGAHVVCCGEAGTE